MENNVIPTKVKLPSDTQFTDDKKSRLESLVFVGSFISRMKNNWGARKVQTTLKELKWEDETTRKYALKILASIKKDSGFIRTKKFYKQTAKIMQHKGLSIDNLQNQKMVTVYKKLMFDEKAVLDQWSQSQGLKGEFDRKKVLDSFVKNANEAKEKNGLCLDYFYNLEKYKKLSKSNRNFAAYLRVNRFMETRRLLYKNVQNIEELNTLKNYDLNWIKEVSKGSYEANTQIGHILKSIRQLEHKFKGESEKEKVSIITCSYGNGHKTAASAVQSYFSDKDSSVIDPSADVLLSTQWLYRLGKLFGKDWKDPDMFNYILEKQLYKLDNWKRVVINFWNKLFHPDRYNGIISSCPYQDSIHKELFRKRFLREMPDQIITVYHMALHPIAQVAGNEMGIPILHLATDYDCKVKELIPNKNKPPKYKHFKYSAPINEPRVTDTLKPLNEDQKTICGFPIRKEFFISTPKKDLEEYKKKHNIDNDTKVLLIMGGGGGQKVPFPYHLAKLQNFESKLRVIVVAGGNNEFGKDIEKLKAKHPNITFQVAQDDVVNNKDKPYYVNGATLSKLMDLADVVLTKSGGASTAEALQKGVPILFDHRMELFPWEESNIAFAKELGRAKSVRNMKSFGHALREGLKMERKGASIPYASERVPELVAEMITQSKLDQDYLDRKSQYMRA